MNTKQMKRNKLISNFKGSKGVKLRTNNLSIQPILSEISNGRLCVTKMVNNKGLKNNPRYNPEVVNVAQFRKGLFSYKGK